MLVKVGSEEQRWQVLRMNTELKKFEKYKNVFINKDIWIEKKENMIED